MSGILSRLERIAQDIQDVVADVTAANGYTVTVSGCLRPTRNDQVKIENYLVLLGQDDEEQDPDGPMGFDQRVQRFTLDLFVTDVSEDATEPIDTVLNEFRGQVLRAVLANRQWHGLAVDTVHESTEPFATADGGAEGLRMTLAVTYRHTEGDPYA